MKRYLLPVERKRPMFEGKPLQFPQRNPRSCTKTRTHCRNTFRVSRKTSIRGNSNHGSILRQPCRYYSKGTCTRSPCEHWHSLECQFLQTKTGCKAGDKCLCPHHKVNEQTNKKPKCSGYCEKLYLRGVVSGKTRVRFLRGNPDAKKTWDGSIRRIRFTQSTLRQERIREKKGPSLGKIQFKNPLQRSPVATKFEDRSHEETERQQRCCRSKAWTLAKNIYIFKEKDKATFYSLPEEWVLPAASTREPEDRP